MSDACFGRDSTHYVIVVREECRFGCKSSVLILLVLGVVRVYCGLTCEDLCDEVGLCRPCSGGNICTGANFLEICYLERFALAGSDRGGEKEEGDVQFCIHGKDREGEADVSYT